jgi:DNA-binding beta-propeller fold protein YncE
MTTRRQPILAGLLLALSLAVSLAACTTTPEKNDQVSVGPPPVWPSPPAEARIRFVRSVAGAQDWGISKSLFRRLAEALGGASDDGFVRPTGVAVSQRVLYVADPGAHALWILDGEHDRMEKVERLGDEYLQSPVAVVVRPDGSAYLADSRLKTVFLVARDGKLIRVAARQGLERPAGLAYDASRQWLYVADSAGQKIIVYGADGAVVRSWGQSGYGDGQFNYPTYMTLDKDGNLLVTDALNFRVQTFSPDGRFMSAFGRHGDGSGDIASPKGIATDRGGHILLVDALFDSVQVFDRDGHYLLGFGGRGTGAGQLWLPGGLFITPENQIYVADAFNRRIQVYLDVSHPTSEGGHP